MENPSRGLLKAMLITGSTQAASIVVFLVRMKVVALLLGPSGIGLLSIFTGLQGMVSSLAGLGMGNSGVRELASVKGEEQALSRVRRVLMAAHLVQGAIAMLTVWLLREPLAAWLLGDLRYAPEIGLIGMATLFGLLGTAQTALLQGMRRIGDLGRVTVLSALTGTVAGLAFVWSYGEGGLIWFVLVQPVATTAIAFHYTRQLPRPISPRLGAADVWATWKPMAKLGIVFMLGGLATTATLLLVRGRISQELGLEAAGQFAAAWGITMTYVGFLLGAMGADYYPRLTEVIHDRAATTRLMNDQTQLGLAIGGPVILLLIGLAPSVIAVLYTEEFGPAAVILQWQMVGNVFKLASWALGFAFIAAAQGPVFLFLEISFNASFILMIWLGLPDYGVLATGPAFLLSYVVYLGLLAALVHVRLGFRWQALSLALLAVHATLAVLVLALARSMPVAAMVASPLLALGSGVFGLRIVLTKIGSGGRLPTYVGRLYAAIGWPLERPS